MSLHRQVLWYGSQPLVLASASVTRRALLEAAGLPVETIPAQLDERTVDSPLRQLGASSADIAIHLARAKALATSRAYPDRLVLGADQTLSLDGQMFAKPVDFAAAAAQLAAFSGRTHLLYSALALARGGRVIGDAVDDARMTMRKLSKDFIATYLGVAGEAATASVGVYQIERLGMHLFEHIEGEYSTILGLPLLPLLRLLRQEGSLAA